MSLAAEASRCEADVEKQCNLILKTDPEFWEIRNKAVLTLTELVGKHERHPNVQDILGMSVFRLLKEPMKNMMADLRSQQVRDTCAFLSRLSQVTGDHMRHFLRDSFPFILDGVKVPNKVMSGFVDECIISMIKNTTFKTGIHTLLMEIKESKAKVVRERCLEYINEILVHWDLQDRDIDAVAEAITVGLEDASVRGREIARLAYLNLFTSFPRKTEKLKAGLSSAVLKTKLSKQEEQHTFLLKQQELAAASAAAAAAAASASAVSVAESALDVCDEQHEWVAQAHSPESEPNSQTSSPVQQPSRAVNASPLAVHGVVVAIHTPAEAPHISSLALLEPAPELRGGSLTFATGATPTRGASTPGKLSLRVRRQSCQEGAVTSIQAIIRGTLTRRQSLSGAVVGAGATTPLAVGGPRTPRLSAILSPSAATDKDDKDRDQLEDEAKSTPPSATAGPRTPMRPLGGAAHGTPKSPSAERSPKQSPAAAPVQRILSAASPRKLEALTLLPTPTFASSGEPGWTTEPKTDNGSRSAVSPACTAAANSDVSSSSSPAAKAGREIAVGASVTFQVGAGSSVRRGFVRFVGLTSIAPGSWVGIDVVDDKENGGDEAAATSGGSPSSSAGKSKSMGKARAGTNNSSSSSGAAGNGVFIRAEQVLSVGPAPSVATSARRSASPSTSRPLSPWVPTSPSPRAALPSPFYKLSRNDSKRRTQVASLLKVKIAQLTALLGQQLELVERLESVAGAEGQGLGDDTSAGSGQAADVVGEILAATAQETQLIGNFQDRLKATLR